MRLLAGLSKFVIADITNPKSSPLELQATVPEMNREESSTGFSVPVSVSDLEGFGRSALGLGSRKLWAFEVRKTRQRHP